MKFRIIFTLLIVFVFTITSFAQNSSSAKGTKITGTVVDAKSGEPLTFATIALQNAKDGKAIRGGQTDLDGKFTFENIDAGAYLLKVSFVGYANFSQSITVNNQPLIALGTLKVQKSKNSMLNEVVVTGKKNAIELGIDRKVFNAEQSLVSKGGSATDLLATVPSVQVDIDGNVSLRGTSNVKIMIDGKPSTFGGGDITSLLQSLPASAIEKVELITNPSAKYDPEGQSGIINIVLKKNVRLGINGNLAFSAGRYNNYNANGSLNFKNEKWDFNTNYSYRDGARVGNGITNTQFINSSAPNLNSSSLYNRNYLSHTAKVGAAYSFTENTQLGLSADLNIRNENNYEGINQLFYYQNNSNQDYGIGKNDQLEHRNGYDVNLDFSHKFKKDTKEVLTANLSFGNSDQTQNEAILQNYFDASGNSSDIRPASDRQNNVGEGNKNYNIQVDYSKPLNKDSKLELGYRSTLKYNTVDQVSDTLNFSNQTYQKDNSLSSLFKLDDIVHAVYANYQNQITKNFGLQFGLRAEQAYLNTNITGTDVNGGYLSSPGRLKYFRVYPSIYFTQKFKGDNQLQLSYSRRVDRPRGWQVNPFPDVDDRYNIRIGNPNLKPEDVHSFELSYAKFWPLVTFTSSVYFRQVNDVVQSLRENNPDVIGGTISRYYNIARNQAVGLELISRADITKKWNVTGNLNFYQSYFKGDSNLGINDNSGFNWNGNLTTSITLPKNLSAQISYFYSAPRTMSQGRSKEVSSLDLGLRYDILKRKGSLSFNVRDLTNSRNYSMLTTNNLFTQQFERGGWGQMYNFTFSYRFGKQDNAQKRNQKRDAPPQADDEGGF